MVLSRVSQYGGPKCKPELEGIKGSLINENVHNRESKGQRARTRLKNLGKGNRVREDMRKTKLNTTEHGEID